jgi:hypothetical protein
MSAIRPYLKAVMPSLLALIAVVVQLIFTGKYDGPELATTVMGLLSSLLTFLVSNQDGAVPGWPLDLVPPGVTFTGCRTTSVTAITSRRSSGC